MNFSFNLEGHSNLTIGIMFFTGIVQPAPYPQEKGGYDNFNGAPPYPPPSSDPAYPPQPGYPVQTTFPAEPGYPLQQPAYPAQPYPPSDFQPGSGTAYGLQPPPPTYDNQQNVAPTKF